MREEDYRAALDEASCLPLPSRHARGQQRDGDAQHRPIATISLAARSVYPHDATPDHLHARVGAKLAEATHEGSAAAHTIEDGVFALSGGEPFAERSASRTSRH